MPSKCSRTDSLPERDSDATRSTDRQPPAHRHTGRMTEPLDAMPVPATPLARRSRRPLAIAAATLVILLAAGIGTWLILRPGTFTVHGTFTPAAFNGDCHIYTDIRQGTQVTVTGEDSTVLGVGELGSLSGCEWSFTVQDIPAGHRWYGVTVNALSVHGIVQFTEAEMRAGIHLGV